MSSVRIGLIGGGWISSRHLEGLQATDKGTLVALCDNNPQRRALAEQLQVPFFSDYRELLEQADVEAVIDATPNLMHVKIGQACAEKGVHVLTEKPVTATLAEGKQLVAAVKDSGIQLLVGHHRRHFRSLQRLREIVRSGALGRLVGVNILWALMKGDDYFLQPWRSQKGGGPILQNMIHEVDTLRFICGDIARLTATTAQLARTGEVEDTAAISFQLESGALGTALVSDTAPSPWSYELASGENKEFPRSGENCYQYLGTKASLSWPDLKLWSHPHGSEKGWWEPLVNSAEEVAWASPFSAQIEHFCAVVRGQEKSLNDVEDGLMTLATTLAILASQERGEAVCPAEFLAES